MKSKEDILNSFNTTGTDGLPEMSAADILQAMELYKDQHAQAAFHAAREMQSGGTLPRFGNYEDYTLHVQQQAQKQQQNRNELTEAIQLAANSILPNFLPADKSQHQLSFNFSMQEKNYTARYQKDAEGYWELNSWERID